MRLVPLVTALTACVRPADPGPERVTDCAGHPDHTPCVLVTHPDLTHDVCVDGTCVSPTTCGEAWCNVPGPHTALPDTGQRACTGAERGTIPCPGTPGTDACATTPYCGQDAQVGEDLARGVDRFLRGEAVGGQPVVDDRTTGLRWTGCVLGLAGRDCDGTPQELPWADAPSACEALAWGGHTDWRLPDDHELHAILDLGRTVPALDPVAFPNVPATIAGWWDDRVWSSSSHATFPDRAWAAYTASGDLYHAPKEELSFVLCVTGGGAGPPRRFTRTGGSEPVVEDALTGLVWQGCPAGSEGPRCEDGVPATLDWVESLAWCQATRWGGATDWRLPDAKELRSLVDPRRNEPAIDVEAFPGTPFDRVEPPYGRFWSSTPRAGGDFAWYVDFLEGVAHFFEKDERRHVRCVRS